MKTATSYVCWLILVHVKRVLTIVAASSTNAPGDAAPQVVEALRKVGIKGLPETPERISQSDISFIDQEDQAWVTEFRGDTPTTSILKSPKMQESGDPDTVSGDSAHESNELKPTSRRKSVTFAEGTKSTDAPSSKPKIPGNRRALKTINEIKRQAGLTKIPDRTIKPNKSSNRTSKKQLETGKAGNARQGISGLLMQERAYDARIDSTKIGQKDTDTAVGKSEPPVEIVPGPTSNEQSSYESSYEENTPLKHPPHKEVEVQDVDLALPITPIDESAEDTALRRQMLAYSMNEVGAVVAEIELDEEDEDRSDASNTDDEDGVNSDASSTEEDEDEHGRTKRPVLDDAYLEEMRALEERLNATAIQNVGPDGNGLTAPIMEIARSTTTRDSSLKDLSNTPAESSIPKQVRFVEELDVQNGLLKDHSNGIVKPISKPVKDDIVERVTPWDRFAEPTAAPKKKVSRFKNARAGNPTVSSTKAESDKPVADTLMERNIPKISTSPQSASNQYHFPDHTALASSQSLRQAPTGPPNRTHAPTVVERSYSAITDPSKAVGPDELDPALLHQQVATEYHRIRNRMIQRQGGFLATDEEKEYVPLAEEEGGAPKISRFKAARLAQLR